VSHASARCLKHRSAGFHGRATSLTGSVLRMAPVWCVGAVDGSGDAPAKGPTPEDLQAVSAVSAEMCLLSRCATSARSSWLRAVPCGCFF
jgi:hypothetical protein